MPTEDNGSLQASMGSNSIATTPSQNLLTPSPSFKPISLMQTPETSVQSLQANERSRTNVNPVGREILSRLDVVRQHQVSANLNQDAYPQRRMSNFSTHSLHIDDAGLMISKNDPMYVPGMRQQLFVDAEMMKQRARANLAKKDYAVTDYYSKEGWAADLARSEWFNHVTLSVILLNAIWIGVGTDYNEAEHLSDADVGFQLGEHLFCIFFVLELMVRYLAFDNKWHCFLDCWFRFDLFLVILIVCDTWILGAGGIGDVGILRLFRLLRLTRIIRLMRSVPEIMTIFKGMTASTRSVFTILAVLLVFTYAFSIAFRAFTKDQEDAFGNHFHDIPSTMWTLFLTGALFDNLTEVLDLLRRQSPLLCIFFILYMIVAAFVTMNMLIGILCEVITAVQQAEKEKILVEFVKSRMMKVMEDHGLGKASRSHTDEDDDADEDGNEIGRHKFHELMHDQRIRQSLEDLGIDANHMICMGDSMFEEEIFDYKVEEGSALSKMKAEVDKGMSKQQFMETLIQLRPSNHVSVAGIMELRKFMRLRLQGVEKMQDTMQDQIDMLGNCLKQLLEKDSSSSSGKRPKPRHAGTTAPKKIGHPAPVAENSGDSPDNAKDIAKSAADK